MPKERRIIFDLDDLALRIRCTECGATAIVHATSRRSYPPERCPGCGQEWRDRHGDRNRYTFRNIMEVVNAVRAEPLYPIELKFEVQA